MMPVNTGASSVIFYRHLKRYEDEGFLINIITNEQSYINCKTSLPQSWKIHILPNRKFWYPPYKPYGIFQMIRYSILYLNAHKFIRNTKPDYIIGCIYGVYLSGWCAFLSKKVNKKLYMFYHDRGEQLNYVNNSAMQKIMIDINSKIINQSEKVWTVSEQLVYDIKGWENKFEVVYPIPEKLNFKTKEWNESHAIEPVFGYAGSLYNEVIDIMVEIAKELKKVNGKIIIMSHQTGNVEIIKSLCDNIVSTHTLPTTSEACKYIYDHCTAFIVAYPKDIKTMPWIDSCFPSKFTQFIHTGIPTIVISPKNAAIAIWCQKNNWLGYTDNYEKENLLLIFNSLKIKNNWEEMRNQSITFLNDNFNPDLIHKQIAL